MGLPKVSPTLGQARIPLPLPALQRAGGDAATGNVMTDLILWLGDNAMAVFALAVIALLVHWLYDQALGG